MPQPDSTLDDRAVGDRELHAKSPQWLQALGAAGVERDQAAVRQHQLLLRIARNEGHRRGAQTPITGPELDDLAHQAAGDALLAIGGKLDQFRGESRFTTWAYKFVIFEVSGKLARHFWLNPSAPMEAEHWDRLPDRFGLDPPLRQSHASLLRAAARGRGRADRAAGRVSAAIVLDGVSLDAVAATGLQPQTSLQSDVRRAA